MNDVSLREDKNHGDLDFPIQYYFVDSSHQRYQMALHWHRELEFVRVRSGTLSLFLNNEMMEMSAGDVAFIGSEVTHRAVANDAIYECVVFDLGMLFRQPCRKVASYIEPLLLGNAEIFARIPADDKTITKYTDELFSSLSEEGAYYEIKTCSAIFDIIFALYRGERITLPAGAEKPDHRKRVIIELVAWIEANYTEKIALCDLAKIAKVSEKYLCRIFREYTGNTPIEYINRLRIERAIIKMSKENMNVTEAALDSGFYDMSYFSKVFKRYKGTSPKAYKKRAE